MSKALDTIQRLREEALNAKADIENRITETKNRIRQMCRSGTVEFDECWSAWLADFERYADEGRQALELTFDDYAKPNDEDPISGHSSRLRNRAEYPFQQASRADSGAVFAHVNREEIIQEARAWFESKCANANVPLQDERQAELERLAEQVRKLDSERDDLQDELSRLFRMEPSDRTKSARKRAEEQQYLDMINQNAGDERNASDPSAGGAQIFRQPT